MIRNRIIDRTPVQAQSAVGTFRKVDLGLIKQPVRFYGYRLIWAKADAHTAVGAILDLGNIHFITVFRYSNASVRPASMRLFTVL